MNKQDKQEAVTYIECSDQVWTGIIMKFQKPYNMNISNLKIHKGSFRATGQDNMGEFNLIGEEIMGKIKFKQTYTLNNSTLSDHPLLFEGEINNLKSEIKGRWNYKDEIQEMSDEFLLVLEDDQK
ncbi:UNKNOWN [Stylonychia lemnae]|uniref:Uncharacterized protein n=1 Tax=Stylonychia lemnae TaxID=5949 RepID=A0A077ZUC5_STYLE|nr:UNKNOWN [Stylonychia lemnae]|eukprot:CDW73508.1 UNKNOWN [Stylonychia lemnae]